MAAPLEQAEAMAKAKVRQAAAENATTTPSPRPRVVGDESAPKLDKRSQSKRILRDDLDQPPANHAPAKRPRTAVKAKAAPKRKPDAKLEREDTFHYEAQSMAVNASLHRKDTSDVALEGRDCARSPEAEQDQDHEESSDDQNAPSTEDIRKKKAAHARYMRFSRSLNSPGSPTVIICIVKRWPVKFLQFLGLMYTLGPGTPPEIRAAGKAAFRCFLVI